VSRGRAIWIEWVHEINARPGLHASTVRVGLALVKHVNETGHCWPSQATLAQNIAMPDRTVRRGLDELKSIGAIDIQPGRNRRSSRYTLKPPFTWRSNDT
jgi:DNA-binding IclR family transcriptional regulator